jgi:hypothetical protein
VLPVLVPLVAGAQTPATSYPESAVSQLVGSPPFTSSKHATTSAADKVELAQQLASATHAGLRGPASMKDPVPEPITGPELLAKLPSTTGLVPPQ